MYGEIKRVLEGKEKLDKIEILKNKIQILKDGLGNEIKKLETELNKLLSKDEVIGTHTASKASEKLI